MSLFKPDLFQNFGIGFLIGTLIVGAMTVQNWQAEIASPAMAATTQVAPSAAE